MMLQMKTKKTHDDMVRKLFNPKFHSVFTAILGPNQSGKTVFALFLMQRCHELGLYDYYGMNIPDLDVGFKYDFIEDLQTLKRRCTMLHADGQKRYLYLADEMGDWAPQDQPWLNVKFLRELQKVRKYGLSMIGCGIDRIDQRILSPSYFHGYFNKQSKNHPDRATYIDWTYYPQIRRYTVSDIPLVKIGGFDTYYKADFTMTPQGDTSNAPPELVGAFATVEKGLQHNRSWKAAEVHAEEGRRALWSVAEWAIKEMKSNQKETPMNHTITDASEVYATQKCD